MRRMNAAAMAMAMVPNVPLRSGSAGFNKYGWLSWRLSRPENTEERQAAQLARRSGGKK